MTSTPRSVNAPTGRLDDGNLQIRVKRAARVHDIRAGILGWQWREGRHGAKARNLNTAAGRRRLLAGYDQPKLLTCMKLHRFGQYRDIDGNSFAGGHRIGSKE